MKGPASPAGASFRRHFPNRMTRLLQATICTPAPASIAVALLLLAACGADDPTLARGEALFDTCSPCHGEDGAGNQELGAPAIAGASEWYIKDQLAAFRAGRRGYHHQDVEGLRMRPMSRSLFEAKGDIDAVTAYVTSLPMADPPPTGAVQGDPEVGEDQYAALCANCHGTDGRGNQAQFAPSLLHLSDWYLASSIRKYRDGVRGGEVGDVGGALMTPSVANFTDEQVEDVTAYVVSMRRLPPKREIAGAEPVALPPVEVDPALLPDGVTTEMVAEGQSIFHGAGICYTCHTQGGQGGPLAPDLTDDAWLNIDGEYESIVEVVNTGVAQPVEHPGQMQPRAGMPLTDDQVRAVAAYVFALSR